MWTVSYETMFWKCHQYFKIVLKCTLCLKKQDTKLLPITSPNVNRFSKFCHWQTHCGKFATNAYLNIPPHLKHVATLPCEIWMSENWQQSEICIVINDKWQDSTAKHLSYDGLLHYKFVSHCAGKRIFKIREHLAKLQAKWLIVSYAPFNLRLLSSKMQNSLDKLNT